MYIRISKYINIIINVLFVLAKIFVIEQLLSVLMKYNPIINTMDEIYLKSTCNSSDQFSSVVLDPFQFTNGKITMR